MILFLAIALQPASTTNAADLSPEQVTAIRAQLKTLQDTLDGKASDRNRSAWSVFMSASQDPKAAVTLYENCTRIVDYEREGRSDAEFRDWQSKQRDRYKNDSFMQSMMLQLRWLAISCKAAEAEKFETVLPDVLSYLDSLSALTEMPAGAALNSANGSIFVRAYELERMLSKNENWETVPYNIKGIYEKIILPYMREEKPEQLMNAWDKRISHQTRLVEFIKAKQDDEVKGGRDEKREIMDRQRRETSQGVLRGHDEEDFVTKTLPRLKWDRLIDKFSYVDNVSAAQEMLAFLNENITNTMTIDWLTQFQNMVSETQSPGFQESN